MLDKEFNSESRRNKKSLKKIETQEMYKKASIIKQSVFLFESKTQYT